MTIPTPHPKPIIGIAGGIGSGKSFVSNLFGELGCGVIDADAQSRQALLTDEVRTAIRDAIKESMAKLARELTSGTRRPLGDAS